MIRAGRFTVFFDACVLFSAPLRDLLLELAVSGFFRARWSPAVHEEWISNLLATRPDLDRGRLARTRVLMDSALPDALVDGYQELVDVLKLPDPGDRHVLAAAIKARADLILTWNLQDFPAATLAEWNIEVRDPDGFLSTPFTRTRRGSARPCGGYASACAIRRRPPKNILRSWNAGGLRDSWPRSHPMPP
ncbi:MAG: hypothetical protein KatS3mg119_0220 [Rhodothalassiaceae bacterium]|nr:MAG: hypothetical protein KatS3mg119_0220 [Rhodothalassiaceae bacterium]